MEKMRDISEEDKKYCYALLSKLMEGCYVDTLTGQFFCKKCNCPVSIDWNNHMAFCVIGGKLCVCVDKKHLDMSSPFPE